MSSVRRVSAFLAISLIGFAGSAGAALAQAWGEQAPVQFKYANQGATDEVERVQLGTAAITAGASTLGSGGSGGSGQSSGQTNNAVEVNSNNTYNVTVSGSSGTYLNFGDGATATATQTSTGTTQTSKNSSSSPYLNK